MQATDGHDFAVIAFIGRHWQPPHRQQSTLPVLTVQLPA
jgi:hypothetical protein